jgi:hypothetical protein
MRFMGGWVEWCLQGLSSLSFAGISLLVLKGIRLLTCTRFKLTWG